MEIVKRSLERHYGFPACVRRRGVIAPESLPAASRHAIPRACSSFLAIGKQSVGPRRVFCLQNDAGPCKPGSTSFAAIAEEEYGAIARTLVRLEPVRP